MDWFNYIGLIFVVLLLIPNIIFVITQKPMSNNHNKTFETFEQVGRYGSMVFMVFNIPYTVFGYYFAYGQIVYIVLNSVLLFAYYLSWIIFWKRDCLAKALFLSIIPSVIFIVSGVLLANIPLLVFAVLFTVFHVLISIMNCGQGEDK